MKTEARLYRAPVLAAVFGGYFAFIMVAAWWFAWGQSGPWFDVELSRWIYTVYVIVAGIFLTGLALLVFAIEDAFGRRIRKVNRELGGLLLDNGSGDVDPEELLLPDPDEADRNGGSRLKLDVLLETLGEAQNQDVLLVPPRSTERAELAAHRLQLALLARREELAHQQHLSGRLIAGPMAMAVAIFGVSIAMLPGVNGFLRSFYQLNTTLILGFAYAWIGLAAYVVVAVLGTIASLRRARKRPRG